jgi:hypothetical protein
MERDSRRRFAALKVGVCAIDQTRILKLRAPALLLTVHGRLILSMQRARASWTGSRAYCTYISEEQSKVFKCGLKICTGVQHH